MTCVICKSLIEFDDIAIDGTSIKTCLRCFERANGNTPHLSKPLERELIAIMGKD